MAVLDVIKEVELKADAYLVINTLLSIGLNIAGVYSGFIFSTYIWRLITCPC